MTLWDDLPGSLRDGGALAPLQPLLEEVTTPASSERAEPDGTWRLYTTTLGGQSLTFDPATGAFTRGAAGTPSTPIEIPNASLGLELGLRLTAPGGDPDGTVRLIVSTPSATVRLPFLRGAALDAQGQLRPDPAHPDVRFLLPALRLRFLRPADGPVEAKLLSAATGPAVDEIYDFVRMEPPYALVGPGNVVGFAFRAAVLDLSGTAGPSGVPPEARAMPGDWQGLYLPEVRLFVAPSGLEGLAVNAGVRDLWIGLGRHAGVTGLFEAEIVQRGTAPTVRLRFQTETGAWIGVPDATPPGPIELPERTRLFVDAGGGLAPFSTEITLGGTTVMGDRADVTTPAAGSLAVTVRVSDAGGHVTTRSLQLQRRAPVAVGASPGSPEVTVRQTSATGSRIVIAGQTDTHVLLRLEPPGGDVSWSWAGGSQVGDAADVPLAAGAPLAVTARRVRPAASVLPIDAYMLFGRPRPQPEEAGETAFAANPANTHT